MFGHMESNLGAVSSKAENVGAPQPRTPAHADDQAFGDP